MKRSRKEINDAFELFIAHLKEHSSFFLRDAIAMSKIMRDLALDLCDVRDKGIDVWKRVSTCPKCASPIYGYEFGDYRPPVSEKTCECFPAEEDERDHLDSVKSAYEMSGKAEYMKGSPNGTPTATELHLKGEL